MRNLFTIGHLHEVRFVGDEGVSLVKTIRDLILESQRHTERHMGQLFDDLKAAIQANHDETKAEIAAEHDEVKAEIQKAVEKAAEKDATIAAANTRIADLEAQLASTEANAVTPEELDELRADLDNSKADLKVDIDKFSDDVKVANPGDPSTVEPTPEPVPA